MQLHSVGDIVYIVSSRRRRVLPAQVVEQVIRKTLEGEQVTYMVEMPSESPGRALNLSEVDGTVHVTLEAARDFLHRQATLAIDEMIAQAHEICEKHFVSSELTESSDDAPRESSPEVLSLREPEVTPHKGRDRSGPSKLKVRLEDGTSATVTLPGVQ